MTPRDTRDDGNLTATDSWTKVRIALLVALAFVLGSSEFVVIGIEPQIATAFSVTLDRAGELVSVFALAYAICTPVLALTTGRFRRFPLLVSYTVIFCAANLVAWFAPTFTILMIARIALGAVSGALLAQSVTYIPELVSVKRVSPTVAIVYAAFAVAMIAATAGGKLIGDALGWHMTMAAAFWMAVIVCAAVVCALPRAGATDEPATVSDQLCLLRDPRALSCVAIFVFGIGSVYVLYAYVTPYLEDVLGMSSLATSTALMGYGLVCIASNLLSGWIDARFGMRALVPSFLIQAALLFALYAVGGLTAPALAIIMAIGLSMYAVSVPCVSMFMSIARTDYPRALTLSASLEPTSFNIGIAFGTAVGGAVVAGPGMRFIGIVGSGFSLIACALVIWTIRLAHRHRTQVSVQR
ncbi:major facilitator superfamily MFS_1 [Coriobacterium glomerans PW2]|uniref:Major facilitator superfamily MFS_1 n=2 Tax=Coriobacterium TaxID=33870 RepID=F2N732_CORGP|nr:major facilitator superfamily MFS_1 [Coriobacterium glomerans PW2]